MTYRNSADIAIPELVSFGEAIKKKKNNILGVINFVKLIYASAVARYSAHITHLVIDADCEDLRSKIVAADNSMVLWDRLIRVYLEFVDSTEGGLRALKRVSAKEPN